MPKPPIRHALNLEHARQQFKQAVAASGHDGEEPVSEAVLIDGGFYTGHRFRQGTMEGVWLVNSGQLMLHETAKVNLSRALIGSHQG